MSSKLVKKQLSSLIAEQSADGQKALSVKSKKAEKRRALQVKKKTKELQKQAQATKNAKLTVKKNTRYYQSTKGSSDENAELMSKLLATSSGRK